MTAFVILDRASQVVIGAALGDVGDSVEGYGRAALDAFRRLHAGEFGRLRWEERMERAQIVAGTDKSAWTGERRPPER